VAPLFLVTGGGFGVFFLFGFFWGVVGLFKSLTPGYSFLGRFGTPQLFSPPDLFVGFFLTRLPSSFGDSPTLVAPHFFVHMHPNLF